MQLTVRFTEKITLPLASAEVIQGLIYRALSTDENYATNVHENGNSLLGRKYKLFTFSELTGKYTVTDGRITYPYGASLRVSSADPYFIQLMFSYFNTHKRVLIGEGYSETEDARISDIRIFKNEISVRTLSPITVYQTEEDGHTTYFAPTDSRFAHGIEINARRKYITHYGTEDGFDLKVTLNERTPPVKRMTRFKSTFITAWHCSLILSGSPQTLDLLYNVGLGSKNSQGFGMFTLLENERA